MNPAVAAWLVLAGIFVYVASVDPNITLFLDLWVTRFLLKFRKIGYSLLWNPAYPWGRQLIRVVATRNANINARILRKELNLPDE